ncbi:hypothetical protein LWI29_002185 [Acer saccharum]|uniref:UspA domain-containing protein n=1 Tax=Acer saccharum TaxID=4024 RepID=A0AA39SQV8_ACESA|nr:hypothetical protein LWI29_002185 [Acer saccharum]
MTRFTRCHEIGVACKAWIKKGDPKEVICREVQRVQPDLLVVGSRGFGPFQRVFVGTVSEFCVKHAECPVITIKRRADELPRILLMIEFVCCNDSFDFEQQLNIRQ